MKQTHLIWIVLVFSVLVPLAFAGALSSALAQDAVAMAGRVHVAGNIAMPPVQQRTDTPTATATATPVATQPCFTVCPAPSPRGTPIPIDNDHPIGMCDRIDAQGGGSCQFVVSGLDPQHGITVTIGITAQAAITGALTFTGQWVPKPYVSGGVCTGSVFCVDVIELNVLRNYVFTNYEALVKDLQNRDNMQFSRDVHFDPALLLTMQFSGTWWRNVSKQEDTRGVALIHSANPMFVENPPWNWLPIIHAEGRGAYDTITLTGLTMTLSNDGCGH